MVAGPGRFSARCFSTEPVLQNAANPEMPAAPIQKPAPDNPDGSVVVSEKVERLCNDILSLNMLELNQLLKVLKVRTGLRAGWQECCQYMEGCGHGRARV